MGPVGFEPTTSRLSAGCSSQTKLRARPSEMFRAGALSTASLLKQFRTVADRYVARCPSEKPTSSRRLARCASCGSFHYAEGCR